MIVQEFILIILNCKKYIKKALFQKKTWLKTIPPYLKYYHVIGDNTMDENYRFDEEENILWLKVNDDYNSLPNKVIHAYNAINEQFNFKYIFKTDDDQILINNNFFNIVKQVICSMTPSPHYGGQVIDIKQPHLSQYYKIHPELPKYMPLYITKYCSGRFYFLSKSAVLELIKNKDNILKECLEDYAVGLNLSNDLKKNILNITTNKYFTDIENSDFYALVQEGKI